MNNGDAHIYHKMTCEIHLELDCSGVIKYVNLLGRDYFGKIDFQVSEMNLLDYVSEEDIASTEKALRVTCELEYTYEFENKIVDVQGNAYYFHWKFLWHEGSIYAIGYDKSREIQLNEKISGFEMISSKLSEVNRAIWLQTGESISFNNDCFEKMFNISREEFNSDCDKFLSLIHPDDIHRLSDGFMCLLKRVKNFDYEKSYSETFRFYKDDNYSWLNVQLIPFVNEFNNVDGCIGLGMEITDQIRKEVKLKSLTKELRRVNGFKSNFFINMTHELRTPLNGIVGITDLLAMSKLDDEQEELVDLLKTASESLKSIVNQILDYTRLENDRMILKNDYHLLKDMVLEVSGIFAIEANSKHLQFEVQFDENLPILFWGDKLRVQQVIRNLISNAIKFTDFGTVMVDVKQSDISQELHITVRDTGIGMDLVDKNILDVVCFESKKVMVKEKFGIGLGLEICEKILELMKGKMVIESQLGKGTCIDVMIPNSGDFTSQFMSTVPSGNEIASRFKNVLIIDDNHETREVMEYILNQVGYNIRLAQKIEDGLKLLRENDVDLILVDFQGLYIDIDQYIFLLKDGGFIENDAPPIIALVDKNDENLMRKLKMRGIESFVSKPVDYKTLVDKIHWTLTDRNTSSSYTC